MRQGGSTGRRGAGPRKPGGRSSRFSRNRRPKFNRFVVPVTKKIEYKDVNILPKFLTETGKILSRRITGLTAKQQRDLSVAIRRARLLGLLPTGARRG